MATSDDKDRAYPFLSVAIFLPILSAVLVIPVAYYAVGMETALLAGALASCVAIPGLICAAWAFHVANSRGQKVLAAIGVAANVFLLVGWFWSMGVSANRPRASLSGYPPLCAWENTFVSTSL